jgi:hypothetical protein
VERDLYAVLPDMIERAAAGAQTSG